MNQPLPVRAKKFKWYNLSPLWPLVLVNLELKDSAINLTRNNASVFAIPLQDATIVRKGVVVIIKTQSGDKYWLDFRTNHNKEDTKNNLATLTQLLAQIGIELGNGWSK